MVVTSPVGGPAAAALEGLTPSQRHAVETPSQTVCVLASAGAGKTRVLARRVGFRAHTGTAAPAHVLAITFTRKAAGELQERLKGLGLPEPVTAGTFHSFALSQLRRWWADRRTPEPSVLERKGRLLKELATDRPALRDVPVGDLATELEWAKARLIAPSAYPAEAKQAGRPTCGDPEAVASLFTRYEHEKRRRRLVDFDDLLARYADALRSDTRFGAAQRWRWRHIFVDELQDVNPLQCSLLLALLGDNADLFVVGDPNQAIYGWNGADPGFLLQVPSRWPAAEVVRLDDNHRSSPQVVAAAAAVLGRQSLGLVRSSQPEGPRPRLRSFPSEEAEASGVACEMQEAHRRGVTWSDMAVLARTNSQLNALTQALARAAVPFHAVAQGDDVEAAGLTGGVPHPREEGAPTALGRTAASPSTAPAGAQPSGASSGSEVTVCSFHRSKGLQWHTVWICGLEAGYVPIGYAVSPPAMAEERRLLYVAVTRARREVRCSWARHRKTASGVSLRRDPSPWLPVLAAHCELGDGPAMGTGELGHEAPGRPSTAFVDFFSSARSRLGQQGGGRGLAWPTTSAARDAADPEEAEAKERLRAWRRRLARASGVPPYVLLHDSTLDLIAARRPVDTEELLGIPGLGPVKVARFGPEIIEVVLHGGAPAAATG